ncbi:hypothetical protein [Clostridium butyricum]|uniref:hypothetical protein n=1 Tax=Clostridium butyricum TaxID=1492 RepID=UPI00071E9EEA|nr:hypothetical protein [Clostridium butyricum]ALR90193.1 hypothetical protein ATN24_17145 [Clostridium butyricum]ALS19078.1 hypothetical protein ATD26_19600 [Clostridium butyricum]ANF16265.1 hypothetical protein AZ909_19635 [Clostridium butyricum]AOR96176.1 hypothetical protein BBB49_19105 [Clostridium butyricum]MDM8131408.1 hypothetical protein [Clostridium butyricum]
MLPNLLEKLEQLLKNHNLKLNNQQIQSLAEILDIYSGGIVPISVIRRELKLNINDTQELMIYLEDKGILKSMLKVCCPSKSESVREELYDDIRNIPKKYCDKCDENCMYIENISVVFKVI